MRFSLTLFRFIEKSLTEWLELFQKSNKLPYGPVNDMKGIFENEQLLKSKNPNRTKSIRVVGPSMPKRVHSASDRDDDTESTSNQSAPKRTRKTNDDREINDLCQELYDAIRSYKSEDGRVICETFIRLPSKRTHSDYYTLIKQPIDLIRIQQKIRTDEYQTLEQFNDDIQLLLTNAKTFYRKNSNEWRDANDLSKYFYSKINEEQPNRKRILKKNNEIDNEELSIDKKRRLQQPSNELITNGTSIKIESNNNLSIDPYYFEEFFTAIYNANINERAMSEIFLFLPSRKLYPDYYLIVTNPIDLKLIAMKIQNNQYLTLDDMENDLLLMISNAKKYNDPKSQIYKDAGALRKMIINVRNELDSALKSTKNDRLRTRKRDVVLSSEIANTDYPEEPNDEDIIPIKSNDDAADSDTSSLGEEEDLFRILYNAVQTYKLGAQSLIDPFMKLPKKRFHQDYYEEIKQPISMSSIKNHIKKGEYTYLADLVDDLKLMFNNAMQYNQEGSLIYNSAKKLLDIALFKAHELGYDEHKPRVQEVRLNSSIIPIKEEQFELSPNSQIQPRNRSSPVVELPNSQRGRPSKKLLKNTEQNIQTLYSYIRDYQENDNDLIIPFLQLPSAIDYPDYYESIENPIDMSIIKDKMDKGQYKREQDIVDDFNRMFNNAKIYNVDESYIYKNACLLEQLLIDKYKVLMKMKEKLIKNLNANRISNQGITKKSSNLPSYKTLNNIIQIIKNYSDHHGRTLSTAFLALPSKIDYPDYYEIIQRPIDLKRIESRQYISINELSNDLQLMFDNACLYNEPGSTIYRDTLSLQNVFLNQRKKFLNTQLNVQSLIQDLLWDLFIQTFNAEDSQGRFYTDSFTDFSEQVENEPFDIVYTFDLIKQNLNQRRYHRLDVFQDDLFRVFERARKLNNVDSQIYQDTIQLQRFYIRLCDDICNHGNLLRSPALLFSENCLQQELARERTEKDTVVSNNQNSISTAKSSDDDDEKKDLPTKTLSSTEKSSCSKGEIYYIGDFVYIESIDEKSETTIFCIESFEHKDNEDYFNGLQFYRPIETYHLPTKKFLRQEVFLTQTMKHIPMNKIQGLCHVLYIKDYFKYQPIFDNQSIKIPDLDKDIYVCESRYNIKTKIVKKIKWWNLPENKRVKLIPRETILEPIREQLTMVNNNILHRHSISDNEYNNMDPIEKIKETIPYDSVINEKLNENLQEKQQFYEQIVISLNCYYKIGDYVYIQDNSNINNQSDKKSILRIDKIWKDKNSYIISGPPFIGLCDITNRDQLITTTKSSYAREVFKCDNLYKQISIENIKGKCSVLSLKHYTTYRLTEIPENDVYVCESKYIADDHSLRSLTKGLKETPGGPFKLVEDGSFMDVDDQTNSNHASNVDGDEHQSNHLNFETANSSTPTNNTTTITTTTNNTSVTTPNKNNNSRKNSRRGSSARAPCGYLVFASESRKRLIKDNPGIPFGEMSRMIGDQWRRLTATERDKYEEKARERAREQEVAVAASSQVTNNNNNNNNIITTATTTPSTTTNYDSHNMPVINPPRLVNGSVTINGHYPTNPNIQNVHQMNGNIQTIQKPPATSIVTCPPRTQRLVHSEAYLRYIENLKPDNQFISDWPKQLKASMNNTANSSNGTNTSRTLPSNWFSNGSPGLYNNVHEALWSMRDNMWSDVIRIRNVLSDEW
ncbi:unnamed protein product [Adineta steineri]|uniref:Protein polybromo-1 n=1 Tax=Adineta steineri TaxID=433720 RepID=A0A819CW61_9BILA|nr:unnamed protein product [Adineta steineri]